MHRQFNIASNLRFIRIEKQLDKRGKERPRDTERERKRDREAKWMADHAAPPPALVWPDWLVP